MDDFSKVSALIADFQRKLAVIVMRDGARHMMDAHIPMDVLGPIEDELQPLLDEIIKRIEWEPGDEDLCPGEPAVTMAEMHHEAWVQHVQMHS